MFVVCVEFQIDPDHAGDFHAAVLAQAANSLALEADCHVFDVCVDTKNNSNFFLYEKYTDARAFDTHLASEHFLDFDARVRDWVKEKTVRTWIEAGDRE